MPTVTDWLMVGITFVYVVATIFICIFNGRSAKATREQVAESQRQFAETKRLERMPYIDITVKRGFFPKELFNADVTLSLSKKESQEYVYIAERLEFRNIGYGVATDISFRWGESLNKTDNINNPIKLIDRDGRKELSFQFVVALPIEQLPTTQDALLLLRYKDLLSNHYEQTILLTFKLLSKEKAELADIQVSTPECEAKNI